MAIDAHSTTAPAVQPGLLRTWAGAVPVPTPDLTAETVTMLGAIPPLAPYGEAPICSAADLPCGAAGDVRHRGAGDAARARHMRQALEGAIAHGIALLDALDAAGVDLEDEGEAEPLLGWIDGKPTLSDSHDDREAEDDDEPILGAPERHPSCYQFALCDATSSQEHWADGSTRNDEAEAVNEDGGDILDDGEETLGWAANIGQLALGQTTADGDATALERHGRGFLRSGPEDAEDDDPAGAQQRDEDALFWSIDVGCTIGAPLDVEGAHV